MMEHFVGVLVHTNYAYPGSLSLLQPLFKIENECSSVYEWNDVVSDAIFERFVSSVTVIIDMFSKFSPMKLQVQSGDKSVVSYWSDATKKTWGLALPHVPLVGGRFESLMPIFEAEAAAVALGLLHRNSEHMAISLRVDNEALVYALRKGRSNINYVNNIISFVFFIRLYEDRIVVPTWVSTHDQLADLPSRDSSFFVDDLFDARKMQSNDFVVSSVC
jgi:hypothetical protein